MKNKLLLLVLSLFITSAGFCQSKNYFSSGGEMLFSFANVKDNGQTPGSILRWAPVFNLQSMYNHDLGTKFGMFTGVALRNVGYIYDQFKMNGQGGASDYFVKKKFRSYNVGVPVGLKIGNLAKTFLYAGYEIELPFLYKEKTFDKGDKIDKITGWFSPRQELFQHGFFVGFQFPHGLDLKFKYYLSEFHNQNFTDSQNNKPYDGLNAHVFYFSLSCYVFRNFDL
jgi:hypothetical protein